MSQYQNIVVVGASTAGTEVTTKLAAALPKTHRILVIDQFGFAFWPVASLRASIVPGWEERVTLPLRTSTMFPANSQHEVIAPNRVVELRENSVVLERPFEGSRELPFFRCVLATGSLQPLPMRPAPGSTEDEYKAALRRNQADVRDATKIVIVGGGPVGLEYAGEVREKYPKKDITIVHSQAHVLNPPSSSSHTARVGTSYVSPHTTLKLSKALEAGLKALNIKVILDDKVDIPVVGAVVPGAWDGTYGLQAGVVKVGLMSGKQLAADYVFLSLGNRANSSLVEKADPKALVRGMGEMIGVDQYLNVKSSNANSPLRKYYAIGDASATPGWKTAQGALADAAAAAVNILAEVHNRPLKVYVRPTMHGFIVPLGVKHGAGMVTFPVLGNTQMPWAMIKNAKGPKLLVEDLFVTRFKGSEKVVAPPIPA